jgi:hypothetical protein
MAGALNGLRQSRVDTDKREKKSKSLQGAFTGSLSKPLLFSFVPSDH